MAAPTIFGVRHHGPGSARSLAAALAALAPDCLLVEGPPDAHAVLPLLAHAEMEPPVALLIYAPDAPERAAFYPYAVFSPEYQALRYALAHDIPIRFMDLPQANQLALRAAEAEAAAAPPPDGPEPLVIGEPPDAPEAWDEPEPEAELSVRADPLGWLARAAGYADGERWWEHMVEQRRDSAGLFAAILEAMTALRAEVNATDDAPDGPEAALAAAREAAREAHMRQTLRAAQRDGYERIAIVCGAWHAPALAALPSEASDARLLKDLPKVKVQATWVPWTNGRLSAASGYGAGIASPGWYAHLWETNEHVAVRWLARVAHLLREQDLDASAASVIEAVRLAEALAALRDRPLPGLAELNEATQAVLCFGQPLPLALIAQKLIVGEALGRVPDETPAVPVQQDLQREQKRLRLKPAAAAKDHDLDLRAPTDLARSHLLHRLRLLDVPWGDLLRAPTGRRGTFHERWRLQWHPELAVRLVEAGRFGNTVMAAAATKAQELAATADGLPALAELLDVVLLAELPDAAGAILQRVQAEAALAADLGLLMDALPPLANLARYGSVRQADAGQVAQLVAGLLSRIGVGLPAACASLNDEAAAVMEARLAAVHEVVLLLDHADQRAEWLAALARLADQAGLHGLLAGRGCRLLHEQGALDSPGVVGRLRLALSPAVPPAHGAAWVEGLLRGSGLLLLHDDALWTVLDTWLADLAPDAFTHLLPLLRRTFAAFAAAERRQMGERARRGRADVAAAVAAPALDAARAAAALPLVARLLGLDQ